MPEDERIEKRERLVKRCENERQQNELPVLFEIGEKEFHGSKDTNFLEKVERVHAGDVTLRVYRPERVVGAVRKPGSRNLYGCVPS